MTRYRTDAGAFEIATLPGQSQVAVCHSFMIDDRERGKGKAHVAKAEQLVWLTALHYDYAICTVSSNNPAQQKVLAGAGWEKLAEFWNHRSSETTEIWGRTV